MYCVSSEDAKWGGGSKQVVIISDNTPATLPTTGEGVNNLRDDVTIAPGSVLLVLTTGEKYIMGEAGTFIKFNG